MQLEIHARNVRVTEKLRTHIERKLNFALGRFEPRIDRLSVHVEDVNGPRGGMDKKCRLLASVRPSYRVVVEETNEDIYAGVARAAERMGQAIRKRIERRRTTARPRARSA